MKSKNYHWTLDEILDRIPDEPFIVALGTSHTYGSCSDNPDGMLPDNETWPGHTSNLMNMPVLNFGIPGVHNINLTTALMEFLDIDDRRIKNCKMVIMEPRIWDARSMVASDLFERPVHPKVHYHNPIFTSTRHYERSRTWHDEYMISVTSNPTENRRILAHAKKMNSENGIGWYKDFSQRWESSADAIIWSSAFSTMEIYQNLNYINICSKLCKFKGIPFKWFPFVSKISQNLDIKYRNALFDALRSLPNNVFESQFSSFDHDAVKIFRLENPDIDERKLQCKCYHYKTEVYEWLANKIINEIRDLV